MKNKISFGTTFFVLIIAGFTTGMGNGSVFGAATMCAIGRGPYESWGGWGAEAYSPGTFSGFVDCVMLAFGAAFALILGLAMSRHGAIEATGKDNTTW